MQRLFRGFVKIAVLKALLLKAPTPTLYMCMHKSTLCLALYPVSSVFVLITAELGRRFFFKGCRGQMWAPNTYSFPVQYVLMKITLTDVLNVSLDVDSWQLYAVVYRLCQCRIIWIFFSPSPQQCVTEALFDTKKTHLLNPSWLYAAVIKYSGAANRQKKKKKNEWKEKEATDRKQMAKYLERHINEGQKNV